MTGLLSLARAAPGKAVSWLLDSIKARRTEPAKASELIEDRRLWSRMREVMGTPVRKASGRVVMRLCDSFRDRRDCSGAKQPAVRVTVGDRTEMGGC